MELLTNQENTKQVNHTQQMKKLSFNWVPDIKYKKHTLHWIECIESKDKSFTRFVHVNSLPVNGDTIVTLSFSGRLRFKIENEGFNTQKNGGYGLTHKYSRISATAMKNYISLLQLAHLLNQLYELSSFVNKILTGKQTLKNLWKDFLAFLCQRKIEPDLLYDKKNNRTQFRYE